MFNTLLIILYAAAAAIAAFTLAMALGQKEWRKDQIIYFAVLLITLLAHVLGELFLISEAYRVAPHLAGAEFSIRAALGPAVFFYARSLISPKTIHFGGRDWLSLTGPALVMLTSLPFAFLSAEEKLALVDPATRDPVHFQIALFTCTSAVSIFLIFTAIYLIGTLRLQVRHRRDMMRQFANIERQSLDWLRNIIFVFSGAWFFLAMKQALWVSGISLPPLNLVLAFIEVITLAVFAYLGLQQPSLKFENARQLPDSSRVPILTDTRMARTATKLITALNTNQMYADSELSLRKLSDVTGITKNHISETLSQHLGINFFDFVNSHRVEEAKRLLVETDQTILTIGLEVGFNSRSTFNAAFKKHSGTTPSAYRITACKEAPPTLQSAKFAASTMSE